MTTESAHDARRKRGGTADGEVAAASWFSQVLKHGRALQLQIGIYLGATGAVLKWFLKDFHALHEQSPGAFWAIVVGPPLYIVAFGSFPRLVQIWRQKRRAVMALEPVLATTVDAYFRLDPYIKQSPATFHREDGAHEKVLEWVRGTNRPLLFLSGASGAGKSSVLEGYVLPTLREEGWRVVEVRDYADPLGALEKAVRTPRRRGVRLLAVFDQFEEFIILGGQASAEKDEQFLTRVRELRRVPLPGVCLLFAFRTDYQSAIEALDLDELNSRSTWTEIAPFRRGAARRFLERAPQRPSTELVDRLLNGADALNDTPGLYRPVTLNMLGLALQDFDRVFTGRAERVVPGYLEAAIADRSIREVAPRVIKEMVTEAATKQTQTVTELCATTGLRAPDVTACLNRLAAKGLARRLGGADGLWELSHDFVARQFALLLGRLRPSPWPRVAMVASPILFALALGGAVLGIPIYLQKQASDALEALGVSVTKESDLQLGISVAKESDLQVARFPAITCEATLKTAVPHLIVKGVQALDLSGITTHTAGITARCPSGAQPGKVENIDSLKDLTALRWLDMNATKVTDLEPLKGLTALQWLDLSFTKVENLEPLKGLAALQWLSLVGATRVENVEPLKDLTALQWLHLGRTNVENLEPLKGLRALWWLDVDGTRVRNLEPLKGLTALKELDLGGATRVENLEPLRGLTALEKLHVPGVRSLEPVEDLPALRELYPEGVPDKELAGLRYHRQDKKLPPVTIH
jgi:hypothetical protein